MPRRANNVEIPALGAIDRSAPQLGRRFAEALRTAIRRGDLRPGEALPSTRLLAPALKVSRSLVVAAFEQLTSEGFLEARPGGGTYVAHEIAQPANLQPGRSRSDGQPAVSKSAAAFERIAQEFSWLQGRPFAISVPDGSLAPDATWLRLGNKVRASRKAAPTGYDDPQGVLALREAVATYVRKSRSVHCTPEQVLITSGTQQGLFLACQVLLDARDAVWVEDPSYRGIAAMLEVSDHRIVRVPVDSEGMDVEMGIRTAAKARAAFVTPSHQFPLGMPMSMRRRTALVAWARANDGWIVEDDYDSELRYAGHPFPALQGLDPTRVVYLGTFSKILFPSLRLGYAVLPEALMPAFVGARVLMDRHPPSTDQHVLAAFLSGGHLARHIRRIRSIYAQKRAHLLQTLERHLPTELAWVQPSDQGMHVLLWLDARIDDVAVVARARTLGVGARAVSPLYSSERRRSGLVLGFGGFADEQVEAAAMQLASAVRFVSVRG